MARAKAVTKREIQEAALALGITIPIRSASRRGVQIILRTRDGDYAYTPAGARKTRTSRKET